MWAADLRTGSVCRGLFTFSLECLLIIIINHKCSRTWNRQWKTARVCWHFWQLKAGAGDRQYKPPCFPCSFNNRGRGKHFLGGGLTFPVEHLRDYFWLLILYQLTVKRTQWHSVGYSNSMSSFLYRALSFIQSTTIQLRNLATSQLWCWEDINPALQSTQ